jgi:hypothetical protein
MDGLEIGLYDGNMGSKRALIRLEPGARLTTACPRSRRELTQREETTLTLELIQCTRIDNRLT